MYIIPQPAEFKAFNNDVRIGPRIRMDDAYAAYAEDFNCFAAQWVQNESVNPFIADVLIESGLAEEEYRLEISKDKILIAAAGETGVFYAIQTLKQLFWARMEDGGASLPACVIRDRPRFGHRGFMLDVARHFFGVDEIKRLIDLCALCKLNVFHWHLADDQGWRLESKRFPKLTEKSSYRAGTYGDGVPVEGFYTQDDIREVVAYAAARQMTVIPEIDLPGHASALLHAYPEYSCTGEPVEVKTRFGIIEEILCAGKESVYDFLFALFEEIAALFPAPYIHIGGDETIKKSWKQCPDCQRAIAEKDLRDEDDLQACMTSRVAAHLATLGKTAIVWNDALTSARFGAEVMAQYWIDMPKASPIAKEIANGRRVIVSRSKPYYLDYPHGLNPLQKIYAFDPILPNIPAEAQHNILGVESPLWTEFVVNRADIERQIFPRLFAVAESGWTLPVNKDYAGFRRRTAGLLELLSRQGVAYTALAESECSGLRGTLAGIRFRLKQISTLFKK